MMFLLEMLFLCVIVLHHKLFGDPTVTVMETDNTVKLSYSVRGNIYTFISTQCIYSVLHSGFLKYTSKSYFYKVKLITNSTTLKSEKHKYYTLMCPSFLSNTSYPHRLAINAHYKMVTQDEFVL